MTQANLYLDQVDLCRYWPANTGISCKDFTAELRAGKVRPEDYPFLTAGQLKSFKLVIDLENCPPPVPQLTLPQPMEAGLFPVNEPDRDSLVIVSGNSRITFEVLGTIWAQSVTPAFFLLVDCLGSTIDMAMLYENFTPKRLKQAVEENSLQDKVSHRHLILPGFTAPLAQDFAAVTGWEIEIGPVCAIELPLFLGERWIFPEHQE